MVDCRVTIACCLLVSCASLVFRVVLLVLLLVLPLPLLVVEMAELTIVAVRAAALREEATPLASPLPVHCGADGGQRPLRHHEGIFAAAAAPLVLVFLLRLLGLLLVSAVRPTPPHRAALAGCCVARKPGLRLTLLAAIGPDRLQDLLSRHCGGLPGVPGRDP